MSEEERTTIGEGRAGEIDRSIDRSNGRRDKAGQKDEADQIRFDVICTHYVQGGGCFACPWCGAERCSAVRQGVGNDVTQIAARAVPTRGSLVCVHVDYWCVVANEKKKRTRDDET